MELALELDMDMDLDLDLDMGIGIGMEARTRVPIANALTPPSLPTSFPSRLRYDERFVFRMRQAVGRLGKLWNIG